MMFAVWLLTSMLVADPNTLVDFDSEIVPILTHAGCNAGACHGAAAGRGGFHLSLFGSDPQVDYASIVPFAEGRRVNLVDVSKSLILAKPLGMLDHGGDVVLEENSSSVSVLRRWLEQGAMRGPQRQLTELRIEPAEATFSTPGQTMPLHAIATFSDGGETDVTAWAIVHSDDPASVEILQEPLRVRCLRPGQHTILARFWNRIVPVSIVLPYDNRLPIERKLETPNSFVDSQINIQLGKLNLSPNETADDATFLRRLRLDLTGRLPAPKELLEFQSTTSLNKRERMIDDLLLSKEFSSFWALRLARWFQLRGSPQEPQAAIAYSNWIQQSLESRTPYNDMVRELLTATGDSHLVGAANFTRTVADARQHAELVGSVLMGSRIQCANCHNHPFARWTQDDYHGLAAIFARFDRGRMVSLKTQGAVTNLRTGESAVPRIPGVRFLDESEAALEGFTNWILDADNPQFAKATVNRLWDAMMGRGLVAGVDDFRETNPPSHSQLLDALAVDFVANGYDIRRTIRWIARSDAYSRRPNRTSAKNEFEAWYVASLPKPLYPEVLLDAIDDVLELTSLEKGESRERAITWLDPTHPSPDLDALGRCSRIEVCQSQSQHQGLAAKLQAINGELLNRRIADKNGRLQCYLRDGMAARNIIEDFFLRALSKKPNEEQIVMWLMELIALAEEEQKRWLQDYVWAIVSSEDFSTNR